MAEASQIFDEPIHDVGTSTKSIVFGKYRKFALAWVAVSAVWPLLCLFVFASIDYRGDFDGILFIALLPAMAFGVWWGSIRQKVQSAFMSQFAKRNGFRFSDKSDLTDARGMIFNFGHSKKLINRIDGEINGYPVRLYNFQATTGNGKNSQEHLFTLFEMTARNNIPQLFLNSKKTPFMNWSGSPVNLSRGNILKLEGDFNKYFELYVPREYEQEALQIFTPEVMTELIDTSQEYDLEIIGKQVRIIAKDFIDNIEALNAMHRHAEHLIKLFEKTLSRFSYQIIGDFSPELMPANDSPSAKHFRIARAVLLSAAVGLVFVLIFALIYGPTWQ